jgi:hypothetical protein
MEGGARSCHVAAMWDGMTLIAGRQCGACTVCCVAPNIDKPEIQKMSGAACRHCLSGGCDIYDTRPPVCRAFFCAWRTVEIFGEEWRPDRSGVLPQIETEGIPEHFELTTGISLMLVGHAGRTVRQKWFQDFVVTGVMNSVPLFLALPGPRGCQAATTLLNTGEMLDAVKRGTVKEALEAALKLLKGWDFQQAKITHSGNDVSAPE